MSSQQENGSGSGETNQPDNNDSRDSSVETLKAQLQQLQQELDTEKQNVKKQKLKRKRKEKKLQEEIELSKKKYDELKERIPKVVVAENENEEDKESNSREQHTESSSSPTDSPRSSHRAPAKEVVISSDDLEESLRDAARNGKVDNLTKLLSLRVNMNGKDESGYTPLHWAAINGRADCMGVLIKEGADLNQVDHGGWTPLHYAAYKNHEACVAMLLLQPNVDVECKNMSKKTAAQLASTNKNISSMLKEAKSPTTRKLLDASAKFWTKFYTKTESDQSIKKIDSDEIVLRSLLILTLPNGSPVKIGAFTCVDVPSDIKEREKQLITREKQLMEREQELARLQSEHQLVDETLKKKKKEEEDRKEDMKKKEEKFAMIEEEIIKKMEKQGEADLGNSIFTVVPEDIHFLEEIGSGTFGSVYKAIWKGDLVAAKKLKCKIEDVELIQSFQKETLLLSKMRHPNVVMLMAASCRAPELIIVTELMKSDLAALISSKEKIEWKEKIQMATDIARGMTYLHHMNPPMIHRDLKTGNCLVDEYRRVKVSDFGTAVTKEKMGTELVGTGNSFLGLTMVAAYMPPERLREEQSDEKTDVFSFGVMLWELMLRKIPWEGLTNIQIVARVGYANELLALPDSAPKGCPPALLSMIRDCLEPFPSKRPSFETLLRHLREMECR